MPNDEWHKRPVDLNSHDADIPSARPILWAPPDLAPTADDEWLLKRTVPRDIWIDVGSLVAVLLVCELLISAGLGELSYAWLGLPDSPEVLDSPALRHLMLAGVGFRGAITVASIAILLRLRSQSPRAVGLGRRRNGVDILCGIASVLLIYAIIFPLGLLVQFCWPEISERLNENTNRLIKLLPRLTPLGFVPVALMVGIYEELVFRGFLMPRLRRLTGGWTIAVVISTVLFTLLHAADQTLPALVLIAFLSIVFSLVTIWRKSIVAAIFGHALFDYLQFLGLYWIAGDSWET